MYYEKIIVHEYSMEKDSNYSKKKIFVESYLCSSFDPSVL